MAKFIKANEVPKLIKDGADVLLDGFVTIGVPEEIYYEIEKSFLETGSPKDLRIMFAAGFGNAKAGTGLNRFAHKGMIRRVIGGHWGLAPELGNLANANELTGYNFPQGVIAQMFRDMAANKPGTISHVGLGTFVDPELQGGKINSITTENLVEKLHLNGRDVLFFKGQKGDIALLKGTTADCEGNISLEEEPLSLEMLSIATAVRNNGGIVIVQVKNKLEDGYVQPKDVKIPGVMVDYVVVAENKEFHKQTLVEEFNEKFVTRKKVESHEGKSVALDERKIVARRCAMLLTRDKKILNYGIGMPEVIADVLNEEGQEEYFVPTVEPGAIGGTPAGGANFGASVYPRAIVDQPYQFDFYDGGGIDAAFLGLAQCDKYGNINVSKFGPKIAGGGGFINITQNAKEVVFCGTFTAGGLDITVSDRKLVIKNEGKIKKFISDVEQITFSGNLAKENGKKVTYVTERAVFELRKEGVTLVEIAPGVDLEKDILAQMDFAPIVADDLKLMDSRIFRDEKMGLKL